VRKLYSLKSSEPTNSNEWSGDSAGDERTFPAVAKDHSIAPVAPLNAYTLRSLLPTYTVPSTPSDGDDSKELPPTKDHFKAEVVAFRQYSDLSLEPTITEPSTPSAAAVTIAAPVVNVHCTIPVVAAIAVNRPLDDPTNRTS
jgi:hypothetical protein